MYLMSHRPIIFNYQIWSVDSENILPVRSKLISKLPMQLNKYLHGVK